MNFERYAGMASAIGLVLILLIITWLGLWGPAGHQLTWSDVGEIVKVLGSTATGGAAITGAIIAWRGLEKWRAETIGKKKYELATTVLADFYETNEIIRASRNPFILAQEMGKIDGVDEEISGNASFAPERRLLEHQEFFAQFRSRKYEFTAHFGKAAAAPFDDIWKIRLEINFAVDSMLRHKEIRNSRRPDDIELWQSRHKVSFRNSDESQDLLIPKLEKIIADIEAICRLAIERQLEQK